MIPEDVQAFDLGPIPKTQSFSGLLAWGEELQQINVDDVQACLDLLHRIAGESELSDEHRELLGTEILSKVLAYRHPEDYLRRGGEAVRFPLCFRQREGSYVTMDYEFAGRIQLLGGTSAFLFHTDNSGAPLQLLFHGTIAFPALRGGEMTLIDDVNPFGPGAGIFHAAANQIESAIEDAPWVIAHGHSLGGCLAVRAALRYPEKLRRVWSHNSPRYSYGTVRRWHAMEEELRPELRSLIASYADIGDDFVTQFGDCWIGTVERLYSNRVGKGMLIQRMRQGHQQMLLNDPATTRVVVEELYPRHVWSAVQRLGAMIALFPMAITMGLTRLLFRQRPVA